ncbi:unnamed protein product [Rhizoctonia solani]|uniref:Fungal zn(2)-cys(6) binuclear cluster domain protein n=1 Tax=Rhizoctonia solani TaxID=456999 RepID=A0A8H3GL95_9AGAM|nr:unnamed protein product [Rhizoctonia solani]
MDPSPHKYSLLPAVPAQVIPRYKPNDIITLSLPIPRGINANRQMRGSYLSFILEGYESHRVNKFFRPPAISMRGFLRIQMKRSHGIIGFMYLAAKVFEALAGKQEVAIQSCSQWVTRYSKHVMNPDEPLNPYPSIQEIEDRLGGLIELAFLQFIVLGTAAGYTTLRLALPTFLRLVSDDPNLCVEQKHNGLLCISLPGVLSSSRVDIRRFVFHDIMYSLVLGLPTLADYDSAGFPIVPGSNNSIDWVHGVQGVPVEMIVNIAEVHNWRNQAKGADWRVLEMRSLVWMWNQSDVQSDESVQMVYRVAIQEAWRHATLIYIYMGVCGVNSHDARVQASVHQIVKLMRAVGDTHLDVHFSIPSVIAGLAARFEPQRALILQKLKTFDGLRLWILRGRDFACILEQLWHGAAVDGAAVGWDEYVQARCEVLPI